ncbi:hypothetical protein V6N13_121979 [Hibiscus sabdariffa]|uniref:Uncharacterized protein n=1 Tax=Hibiscus sabdariffa TaxID=183260 RepID=A0ABR2C6J0_9ROSI
MEIYEQEEGYMTPRRRIQTAAPPPAPKKKKQAVHTKRQPPRNGFFQPPDLEAFFSIMAPKKESCGQDSGFSSEASTPPKPPRKVPKTPHKCKRVTMARQQVSWLGIYGHCHLEAGIATFFSMIFNFVGDASKVCGMKWSHDDRELASGGNDNQVSMNLFHFLFIARE